MVLMATEYRVPRVLCVDDNHDAADSEAQVLTAMGYVTRACYDGPSALQAAREFQPDVCLVDLNMPGMDGDELAGRLREWAGDNPLVLIAVTGRNDAESRVRIEAAGFDRHFVKPAGAVELAAAIEQKRRQ